jgi:ATP-dependent helicase/DNAse subunit B
VFEAIGRKVDSCVVTGMHQDYPAPPSIDAFIANRFLVQSGHPEATAESGFMHAKSVMNSLLSCATNRLISYPSANDQNREIVMQPSSLFRGESWRNIEPLRTETTPLALEHYQDTQGSPWLEPGRAKGGSKIFENQSNCAFKAFATHQLGFLEESEAEFGLDGLDRGNVVHQLLDMLWERLQTQVALCDMSDSERLILVKSVIEDCFTQGEFRLTQDKMNLLKHEKGRLTNLLLEWSKEEGRRPTNFSVIEREELREGEFDGIRYQYIIDRLDITDDGRSVIIDYKTGTVNRNDWTGERIRSPQMPLYALALDKVKDKPVSGIAFAQVKSADLKFIELSEQGVFRKDSHYTAKYEDQWRENRQAWPAIFSQLAKDFLSGQAVVNPIDEKTCQYCELTPFCRVSQLRADQNSNREMSLPISGGKQHE